MLVILENAALAPVEHGQNSCEQVGALYRSYANGNVATSSNSGKRFSFLYCYYIHILFFEFKSLYDKRQKNNKFHHRQTM